MTFFIDNWFLVLAALVSGGLLLWPLVSRGTALGQLSVGDAVMLINREKAVLIDVSEPKDYAQGHASGAKNVPLDAIDVSAQLPKNKAVPLVVLCANGSRSSRAVAALKKLGHDNARMLAGGTAAWRDANLPIDKAAA